MVIQPYTALYNSIKGIGFADVQTLSSFMSLPTNNNSLDHDQIQTRNWQHISQAHISVGCETNVLLI